MKGPVRQHHTLATTGKLGQGGKATGSKPSTHGSHGKGGMKKSSGGSGKKGYGSA